jgi:histidine ammonia-lyase
MAKRVVLDGNSLDIESVIRVARSGAPVSIAPEARKRVHACRKSLEKLIDRGDAIYGVTTGIGEFARIKISRDLVTELQRRIIRSHAAGTGDIQPEPAVRAAILGRANTIAKGFSGVRMKTLTALVQMLNRHVTPIVYEKGSLGTSGDLSPMAQIAEVLIGGGEAYYTGLRLPGAMALKKAGLEAVELASKEGLGLINGSQMITGELALACHDAENIIKHAIIASGMTIDALGSLPKAFDERLHRLRPFPGQIAVADAIRKIIADSRLIEKVSGKVQDGYSLRCAPQILGPTLDTLAYVERQVQIELNAATDNPLFLVQDQTHLAGGNFHGQPIGMAADFLGIAMAEIGSLGERHINRLLNPALSGLPDFLVESKGLNSGLMVAQYTAAALASENKVLAHPGVVDSISVSADQEDHVSMGPVSVRKLKEISRNVTAIIAIELICAAQALDFRQPRKAGKGTRAAFRRIRSVIERLVDDRPLHPDINNVIELVNKGSIVKGVERAIGPIHLGDFPY